MAVKRSFKRAPKREKKLGGRLRFTRKGQPGKGDCPQTNKSNSKIEGNARQEGCCARGRGSKRDKRKNLKIERGKKTGGGAKSVQVDLRRISKKKKEKEKGGIRYRKKITAQTKIGTSVCGQGRGGFSKPPGVKKKASTSLKEEKGRVRPGGEKGRECRQAGPREKGDERH